MIVYKTRTLPRNKNKPSRLVSNTVDGFHVDKVILLDMAFGSLGSLGLTILLACALL